MNFERDQSKQYAIIGEMREAASVIRGFDPAVVEPFVEPVRAGLARGIDLDNPTRARKVGDEATVRAA